MKSTTSRSNNYDVFISYSRKDKVIVHRIANLLRDNGFSVWMDIDGIESGEAYRGIIVDAIEKSKVILFFSSESSNVSRWTCKEIILAGEMNKYIIPIKLDSSDYNHNIRIELVDLDFIDLSVSRNRDASISRLIRSIRNYLERPLLPSGPQKPKSWIDVIKRDWKSRSMVVNIILALYCLILICGLCGGWLFSFIFYPVLLLGIIGISMLLLNKEDGVVWVNTTCILWTLCNAYVFSYGITRFFQQSSFFLAWLPLCIACLTVVIMFFRNKKGVPWWKQCKKISLVGALVLGAEGIFWIWLIAFDTFSRLGLPTNFNFFVHSFSDYLK